MKLDFYQGLRKFFSFKTLWEILLFLGMSVGLGVLLANLIILYGERESVQFMDSKGLAPVGYSAKKGVVWLEVIDKDWYTRRWVRFGGFNSLGIATLQEFWRIFEELDSTSMEAMASGSSPSRSLIIERADLEHILKYDPELREQPVPTPGITQLMGNNLYIWLNEQYFSRGLQGVQERALAFKVFLHELQHVAEIFREGRDRDEGWVGGEEVTVREIWAITSELKVLASYFKTHPPTAQWHPYLKGGLWIDYRAGRSLIERLDRPLEEKAKLLEEVERAWEEIGIQG